MGIFDSLPPKRDDLIGKWMPFISKRHFGWRYYADYDTVVKVLYSAETFELVIVGEAGRQGKLIKGNDGVEYIETD